MQYSEVETVSSIIKDELSDSWAGLVVEYAEKETNLGAALHKMSQNVTVLLTTLELTQMTGELGPEDLTTLLDSALQLRDCIRILRATSSPNEVAASFAPLT